MQKYRRIPVILVVLVVLAILTSMIPASLAATFNTSPAYSSGQVALMRVKRDGRAPTAPSYLKALTVTDTMASLSWTASTDNIGVTGYLIYRNSVNIATVAATSFTVTNLSPNTTYSYYVRAKDAAGNLSYPSNTISVKTLASADTTPPTVPGNLTVSSVTSVSCNLSWSTPTDNVGVVSYQIFKDGVYIASALSTNYLLTNLTPGTSYTFYVKAQDAAGNVSAASSSITVRTILPDTSAPSAPANLSSGSVTQNSLILSWSPSADDTGVVSYTIYKDGLLFATSAGLSYAVTALQPETTYTFDVTANDAAGNTSPSSNVLSVTTLPILQSKIISGYYASWAAYSGYTPAQIPASQLTIINYAFANIGDDLKIELGDPYVDPTNFTKLNDLKKLYPNLKTMISIGGWSWSGKFSDVALTDSSRSAFADSVVAFIKNHGFNGVDIDWEYPVGGGLSTNTYRPEDKHNFTLLMAKLRERLDIQGTLDGAHYLLTFAGAAGSFYAANTELSLLANYVDYANIMTYDIHGTWESYTDFNAPLYTPSEASPNYKWSVDDSIKLWQSKGFPISKIVVGVPFYGYRYTGVTNANNGLYQRFTGGGSISYDNIVATYLSNSSYIRRVHPEALVPWLFNGSTFISYDDPQSIAAKAATIKSSGVAGAAVWELSNNKNGTLLNTLYNNLK